MSIKKKHCSGLESVLTIDCQLCHTEHEEVVLQLIDEPDCNINHLNRNGDTALFYAVNSRLSKVIHKLNRNN